MYGELFTYIEVSLFGGALQPTDSLTVLKQLMERCFGYNTGAVSGQIPTKLKNLGRQTKQEQFDVFRQEYIINGKPLREIAFQNKIVRWEDKDNGIYRSCLAETFPPARMPPPAADSCGFCVMNTLTGKCVSVPAVSCGTNQPKEFLDLVILLNHNQAGAKYDIRGGLPLEIFKLFERAGLNRGQEPRMTPSKLALASSPCSIESRREKRSPARVGAHTPDAENGTPRKRLRWKTLGDPESPVTSTLQTISGPSATAALPEAVPPAPKQEEVEKRKEAAKQRAEARPATPSKSGLAAKKIASPAGTKSLKQQEDDSSSEAEQEADE